MTTQYPDTTYCQLHEVHYYLGQQCPKCKAPPATGCACGAAVYEAHGQTERCTPVAGISPETRALWEGDAYERGAYLPATTGLQCIRPESERAARSLWGGAENSEVFDHRVLERVRAAHPPPPPPKNSAPGYNHCAEHGGRDPLPGVG